MRDGRSLFARRALVAALIAGVLTGCGARAVAPAFLDSGAFVDGSDTSADAVTDTATDGGRAALSGAEGGTVTSPEGPR